MEEEFKEISKELNKFYVYVYLDPRKPGRYEYGDHIFDFEPFYVGKGKESRWKVHFKPWSLKKKTPFYNKLNKILGLNLHPIVLKTNQYLFEQDALNYEIWLIWGITRYPGPLTNLTDGGDGPSGRVSPMKGKKRSAETIEKFRKSKIGKPNPHTKEWNEKIRISNTGKKASKEHCLKISIANKGKIPWSKGKTNIFSLDVLERIKKTRLERGITGYNFQWEITYQNETIIVKNLKEFCRSRNIKYKCLQTALHKNIRKKIYKGYTVRKIEPQEQQVMNL